MVCPFALLLTNDRGCRMLPMRSILLAVLCVLLLSPFTYAAPDAAEDDAPALSREATVQAQREVAALYKELQGMRGDGVFHELGFSSKNRKASDWKKRTEALRNKMQKDTTVAIEVRAAPSALLMLGLEWVRHKGQDSDMAKWHKEQIAEALTVKL